MSLKVTTRARNKENIKYTNILYKYNIYKKYNNYNFINKIKQISVYFILSALVNSPLACLSRHFDRKLLF